jgi:hypothetical protein
MPTPTAPGRSRQSRPGLPRPGQDALGTYERSGKLIPLRHVRSAAHHSATGAPGGDMGRTEYRKARRIPLPSATRRLQQHRARQARAVRFRFALPVSHPKLTPEPTHDNHLLTPQPVTLPRYPRNRQESRVAHQRHNRNVPVTTRLSLAGPSLVRTSPRQWHPAQISSKAGRSSP